MFEHTLFGCTNCCGVSSTKPHFARLRHSSCWLPRHAAQLEIAGRSERESPSKALVLYGRKQAAHPSPPGWASSIACGSGPEHCPQLLELGIELLNQEGLLNDDDVLLVAQHCLTRPAAYRWPIRTAHGQACMGGTTALWS